MPLELTLKWNSEDVKALRGVNSFDKAIFRAVSKAGGSAIKAMRAESVRSVRTRKGMKVAKVNSALELKYPRGAKEIGALVWRMNVSNQPSKVSDFSFRQAKSGVSALINKGKRTLIKSAFVATMKSGHTGVFVRVGKGRKPIKELLTSSVLDVFNDPDVIPGAYVRAGNVFNQAFERLLPMELGK